MHVQHRCKVVQQHALQDTALVKLHSQQAIVAILVSQKTSTYAPELKASNDCTEMLQYGSPWCCQSSQAVWPLLCLCLLVSETGENEPACAINMSKPASAGTWLTGYLINLTMTSYVASAHTIQVTMCKHHAVVLPHFCMPFKARESSQGMNNRTCDIVNSTMYKHCLDCTTA